MAITGTARPEGRPRASDVVVVSALWAAFTVLFVWLGVVKLQRFQPFTFDMGAMVHAVWLIRNFAGNFSTITGLPILGDHNRMILYPLSLILPANAIVLIVVQAAMLGSGALAVYLLTVPKAGRGWGVFLAGVFFAFPSLQWIVLFDVHPEVFALPLLLWALWALDSGRLAAFWGLIGLALLCREDVTIAVIGIGLMLLLEGRIRLATAVATTGAAWFVISARVLTTLNPLGLDIFRDRYSYLGKSVPEAVRTLFLHGPSILQSQHIPQSAWFLLFAIFLPAPIALAANWRRVWLPLPSLCANLLSAAVGQRSIFNHYTFLIIPFVFYAAADGAGRVSHLRHRSAHVIVPVASLVIILASSTFLSPFTARGFQGPGLVPKPRDYYRLILTSPAQDYVNETRFFVHLVPAGSPVAASTNLLVPLSDRSVAYMLPNPFLPTAFGRYLARPTPKGMKMRMPAHPPEWVLAHRLGGGPEEVPEVQKDLLDFIARHYTPVASGRFMVLWRLR